MHYFEQLSKDKKLVKILDEPLPVLEIRSNVPLRLMASIMSQQLSTQVAKVLYKRFLKLFNGDEPQPADVIKLEYDQLRGIGLSNAKVNYVTNVAQFFLDKQLSDAVIYSMSNEDLIELLTQIKGVGKWTVEMLLMFTLGREDVFAVDDLGIQQAMCKLYKISSENKKDMKEKMLKASKKWSPYRTYACLHLWRWKDE